MNFYIFNNGIMREDAMSGCEQRVLNWLPLFFREAQSITVITSKQGRPRFERFNNAKVIETTGYNLRGTFGLFISYLVRAMRGCTVQKSIYIDRNKKTIIYSASDLMPDLVPALFLKLKNREAYLIVGVHLIAPLPWKGFKKHFLPGFCLPSLFNIYYFLSQKILLGFLKKLANLILVSNEYDCCYLIARGFEQRKVLVTHGAVDHSIVESVVCGKKVYDACYVGRFHPQKGFTDLIHIWKRVIDKFSQAKLIVIGYDVNLEAMKNKVQKARLNNNITFLGSVDGIEKYTLIKQSKLALVPSYYESFGMVILEAMACGVAVVAYNLPVFSEIYTKGMVKSRIGNVDEMAENIIELITDNDKREKIGKEAIELSKQFTWEKTGKSILERIGL